MIELNTSKGDGSRKLHHAATAAAGRMQKAEAELSDRVACTERSEGFEPSVFTREG